MVALARASTIDLPAPTLSCGQSEVDQRVFLHNVSWEDYDRILAIRDKSSRVRITYLEGELELMSLSIHHERIKKTIARLLEAYAEERGLDLNGYGSWTVRKEARGRGVEADECYVLGSHEPDRPDLAIEVIWTSGGIDKLEVYRGLGVKEVWLWRNHAIEVYVLSSSKEDNRYERVGKSALLADLDVEHLASFAGRSNQTRAVREYRASLGASRKKDAR